MQDLREPQNDIHREARLLLRAARAASLAVIEDEYPALALVTPAVTLDGAAIVLLSQLSAHTRALDRDGRCALMVSGAATEVNPQTSPRLSLVCDAERSDDPADRARYLAVHPYAGFYAGFGDFGVYRLSTVAARYVGGFARAATLDVARLGPMTGPLCDEAAAAAAMAAANRERAGEIDAMAHRHGGAGDGWRMVTLDADGFDLAREDRVLRVALRRSLRVYGELMIEMNNIAPPTQV
ncbi:MAG: pyridoxamine 5-phosphate oxidase [Acidiphilium sp. 37-64-53]|uniref:HugZ family pyridoxamine 5'-phosphate oxidase n=1 Tax=Acidiphilium TaxID=522 RepID=UPI000BDC1E6B|nr:MULTISPECIES: pyridoxamine 5-phosphate oxidase [Acidiphilium]OYW03163.1 MAG: pyridoxamine 5-phosphate oxidase [Acidiphilium sp. 37-64-53]OZB28239.1 MAG: pyridoxamine 5-phosphate oxidase [Acidiphilium sp. 34-64-41]HQT85607.1 pyridoxamine 5-phosphate oxidase [Acidiphilium rubrum]